MVTECTMKNYYSDRFIRIEGKMIIDIEIWRKGILTWSSKNLNTDKLKYFLTWNFEGIFLKIWTAVFNGGRSRWWSLKIQQHALQMHDLQCSSATVWLNHNNTMEENKETIKSTSGEWGTLGTLPPFSSHTLRKQTIYTFIYYNHLHLTKI